MFYSIVPPLRERGSDIPLLADHFLRRVAREHGVEPPALSPQALARMTDYACPGNVRELAGRARRERWTLEREHILQVLEDTAGNQVRAAEILGIDRRTLHRKLKEYRAAAPDPA